MSYINIIFYQISECVSHFLLALSFSTILYTIYIYLGCHFSYENANRAGTDNVAALPAAKDQCNFLHPTLCSIVCA